MHDYAIDRSPKQKVLFVLAFLAIASTPHVNTAIQAVAHSLALSVGWASLFGVAIPVFVSFGFLYFLFDQYLWKFGFLRRFLLVPDLNGRWVCDGHTWLKEGATANYQWTADVTITQSWSKILIHLKTQQSSSRSTSASIRHDEGVGYRLLYQYQNEPRANESELSTHTGAAEIQFPDDCTSGSGHYYTDRHRSTVGTMELKRSNGHQT